RAVRAARRRARRRASEALPAAAARRHRALPGLRRAVRHARLLSRHVRVHAARTLSPDRRRGRHEPRRHARVHVRLHEDRLRVAADRVAAVLGRVDLPDATHGHPVGARPAMLDILYNLGAGFIHVFAVPHLVALIVGLVVGMLVAVLPGLTLVMGVVLALPFTYGMDITTSIILLTAMYVSGTYGGAFTSILFHIPGEPIDVPLLWDGFPMARKGEPAKALGWTLFAALSRGLITCIVAVS